MAPVVQTLEPRALLSADFGDAPLPYAVTISENGAQHADIGPRLGSTRDTEANGIHSVNADADGADDDGVTFGSIQVGEVGSTIIVNVQGSSGKLDAWIDFNRDGSWGGPGEQIVASQNVSVGNNNLTFDVPYFALAGATYSRFRLSTAGNLGPKGAAADGEVEDYQVTIAGPMVSSDKFGGANTISAVARSGPFVFAADMDRDGDLDMLSGHSTIAWYENDGIQNFTPHTITTLAHNAYSVFAADMDGDGDMDVLSATSDPTTLSGDNKIAWYENDGSQNFTTRTITTAAIFARSVFAADVDGDGDMDVLSASSGDNKIAWYQNDGSQNFTTRTITTAAFSARSVFAADVDGDGDMDVLSASAADDKIAWYQNNGNQIFTPRTITTAMDRAWSVFAADVDGDGDMDVLSASLGDDKIAWYRNDGNQNFTTRTISTAADGASSVSAADVDGDGDLDVLSTSIYDNKIAWYQNDGSQNFTTHTISTSVRAAWNVFAVDVDGDGGLDVLSSSGTDSNIVWYKNNGLPNFTPRSISTWAEDANSVIAVDMDGDGDLDVLVGLESISDRIAWYENNGSEIFTRHVIDTDPFGADCVLAADMDGDGDLDVLSASAEFSVGQIAWYENDGSQNFTKRLIASPDSPRSVFAADVDGDGDLDVLSATESDDKIAWYENDGYQNFTTRTITTAANGAQSVFAADVDGDGDLDVLSASLGDNKIAWYMNDGMQNFTTRTISTNAIFAASVIAADMDGDGDLDVLSASANDDKIAWYMNDGNQNFTTRTISTAADRAMSVIAADLDVDGDLDVLSASQVDGKIAWYENDGKQNFTVRTITTAANAARSVFAADVDGDGDVDVLSASNITWYENVSVFDFGDAPAPYPTSSDENGPYHALGTGLTLGANRDSEVNGIHSAMADGDDTRGSPDDEDGVTFGTIQVGALGATVTVTVQGSNGKLDAWIDFNGDGSWGGPGEQIFASQRVLLGTNVLTFDVPATALAGTTYARFRLSKAGNLGPEGAAPNGEVEDYQVTIANPAAASGPFGQNTISTAANGAASVFAADMDGDGDMDVVSASVVDDKIAWHENNGSQNFTPRTISTAADGAYSVIAADVDGDGDLDVLSASRNDDKIAWYENDGNQNFTPRTISTAADGAFSVFAADVDGDGDMDVLSASRIDDKIAWYKNDGRQNFTPRTISTAADGAFSVFAADVDGDGDMDVLSASRNDNEVAWYENDGSQNFTRHTITTAADAYSVFAADVDGDGDMDVLSVSYIDDAIGWFENDGSQNFTLHIISTAADGATSVFAADVDGDGDMDVVSASSFDDTIAWYENDGIQNFTMHTISTAANGGFSVIAADVDGDGDLDVLSASYYDDKIAWYENTLGNEPRIANFVGAVTYIENAVRLVLDPDALVTDRDSANFDTGELTVQLTANAQSTDLLEIRNQGTDAGQIGVSGLNVTYGGVVIGTFTGGTGATPLVVTLNANATPLAVQTLLRNIAFRSTTDDPSTAARTVKVTLTDGDGETSNLTTKKINVTAVNDAPTVTSFDTPVSYLENAVGEILDADAVVADVDSANFDTGTLTVQLITSAQNGDLLEIRNEGNGAGQIGVNGVTVAGDVNLDGDVTYGGTVIGTFTVGFSIVPLVVTFNASATPLAVQALLRNITFRNSTDNPLSVTRMVRVTLTDGDGGTSNPAPTKAINVTAVNDAPTISNFDGAVTYVENAVGLILDTDVLVADPDSANFDTGELAAQLIANAQSTDLLEIRNQGQIGISGANVTYFGALIGTFTGGTGNEPLVVTLNANATPLAVQTLLRSITLRSTSEDPSTAARTVNVTLTDGDGGTSNLATKTINVTAVNDPPTITFFDTPVTYVESAVGEILDADAVVADVDSANFDTGSLTAQLIANAQSNDRLEIRNEGNGAGQIGVDGANVTYGGVVIGTFTGGTGGSALIVTLNANATPLAAQALLRNITFRNTSENPSSAARTVTITLYDGDGGTSGLVPTKTINVTAVNDAPTITDFGGEVTYVENAVGLILDTDSQVADVDSASFDTGELTVQLTANAQSTDLLEIGNQGTNAGQIGVSGDNVTYGGVVIGTFTGGTGATPLVVTLNADATPSAVQALLTNITFRSTSDDPSTAARTVTVTLTDGDGGTSNQPTATINVTTVNDAPTITSFDTPVTYFANAAGEILDADAEVADVDSANFDTGNLTVQLITNAQSTDRLEIRNEGNEAGQIGVSGHNVTYGGVVIGTFTGGSGASALIVTFNENATPFAVQMLLRNITFRNTSKKPSTVARTVSVTLTDGDGGTSNPAPTKAINVTVNNAPTITAFDTPVTYVENAPPVMLDRNVVVEDEDSANFDTGQLTVQLIANAESTDKLEIRSQGLIRISGANVTFGVVVIGTFTGGTGAAPLVVTFNANATPSIVQALLRNITFSNTSDNPSTAARTVKVTLTDGDGEISNPAPTKTINVTAVNDAPTITGFDGSVSYPTNSAGVILDADAGVTDADSANFDTGRLTVQLTTNAQSTDRLEINNQGTAAGQIGVAGTNVTYGGVTIGTFTGGTGTTALVVTFNANATPEAVQALLRNIKFRNISSTPSTAIRTVRTSVTDGDGGTSSPATKTISVN